MEISVLNAQSFGCIVVMNAWNKDHKPGDVTWTTLFLLMGF